MTQLQPNELDGSIIERGMHALHSSNEPVRYHRMHGIRLRGDQRTHPRSGDHGVRRARRRRRPGGPYRRRGQGQQACDLRLLRRQEQALRRRRRTHPGRPRRGRTAQRRPTRLRGTPLRLPPRPPRSPATGDVGGPGDRRPARPGGRGPHPSLPGQDRRRRFRRGGRRRADPRVLHPRPGRLEHRHAPAAAHGPRPGPQPRRTPRRGRPVRTSPVDRGGTLGQNRRR